MVDLRSNDGDGETGSVQLASSAERCRIGDLIALAVASKAFLGVAGAVAEGSIDIASAAGGTVTCQDSNSNHGTTAKGVED